MEGHDICKFVYFHSIVFCLDFHWGKLYLRKWGRKLDENKGRGKEASVMEPVANWSRFTRQHGDGGNTAAPRGLYLLTLNGSTNIQSRSWLILRCVCVCWCLLWGEGMWGGGVWGYVVEQRTKDQSLNWTGSCGLPMAPSSPGWHRWLLWLTSNEWAE